MYGVVLVQIGSGELREALLHHFPALHGAVGARGLEASARGGEGFLA